ncbi:lysylphosphatidylglycerol synthase transmembrane domain-containing protein [Kamptonema sp. UHCC 0994]|uniref:lysylphosphatidylglycerol synthase transmembrane domain-containing protein n=1 Tax=Kamptonema sp. UHCC 0994 TaxID=3031329 RepID=UPI0023B97973|nr:lysylphosphatidylglycerol synthase transmembrane domain-containing protein [Kamptonema sp. UHCC 0994]MDF0551905.1 lysylphosphatidylglycerol synthase transmembrane domain-containing protein [Kamptonema sp. UHCC 0994]
MKRLISLIVSLLILAVIYWKIDFAGLIQVFQNCDRWWMAISLSMVIPLTMLTAWRLQQLMPAGGRLGFGEANRLILAASVLNMVLPSKMGDIAKAYFMKQRGHLDGSLSLSLVVFEKACDMLSLLLWCVFGLILYPQKDWLFWVMTAVVAFGLITGVMLLGSRKFAQIFFRIARKISPKKFRSKIEKFQLSWREMQQFFWQDRRQLLKITATSIVIWFGHLLQIWFFILALNAWTPFLANLALSPLAILAGLLPLTFAGVGTRDAALIAFYSPYFAAPTAAALGLLCTSRYLFPAIGGLPFLGQYLASIQDMQETNNQ